MMPRDGLVPGAAWAAGVALPPGPGLPPPGAVGRGAPISPGPVPPAVPGWLPTGPGGRPRFPGAEGNVAPGGLAYTFLIGSFVLV